MKAGDRDHLFQLDGNGIPQGHRWLERGKVQRLPRRAFHGTTHPSRAIPCLAGGHLSVGLPQLLARFRSRRTSRLRPLPPEPFRVTTHGGDRPRRERVVVSHQRVSDHDGKPKSPPLSGSSLIVLAALMSEPAVAHFVDPPARPDRRRRDRWPSARVEPTEGGRSLPTGSNGTCDP